MSSLVCLDLLTALLETHGYVCYEKQFHRGEWCYVFQRDPWENEITIKAGAPNHVYQEYCQSGNIERVR